MGNPQVYKSGTETDRTLYGQHYPHWIPNNYTDAGKILIFNNGIDSDREYSSVEIISPPIDIYGNYNIVPGESFLPHKAEWEYSNTDKKFFSEIISSAQRLPNGNTLICEGIKGHFFEINRKEKIVWEYTNPDSSTGILNQGDPAIDNAVFRALKYAPDYPAFKDRVLIDGDPIETNFNIGNCR